MRVGDQIECYCPRCGLVLAHVVVHFEADNSIGAVECNTCHSRHPYKGPKIPGVGHPHPSSRTLKALLTGRSFEERIEGLQMESVISYHPECSYRVNQAIEHAVFGIGFVIRSLEGRIEVLFRDGVRVLVQGKNLSP